MPDTVLPAEPFGVIVTGMDTVCPGLTTYGLMTVAGLRLCSHRSPVGEVTSGSKARVVALSDVVV